MNKRTQELTTGAMFVAIFAVILIINRQSGGLFEEMIMFILPIPMVGYSSKFGLKSSIPVLVSMVLISVIVSTPTGIFYAVTEALIGLVLGSCVYAKKDMTKTLLAVMGLSAVSNVLNTIVLASLFGTDLSTQIAEMQDMMNEVLAKVNTSAEMAAAMQTMMTTNYLTRLLVIAMVLLGLLQGLVVYELSLLILRRLKFHVPKPRSVYTYYPPLWSGVVAFIFFFIGNLNLSAYLPQQACDLLQITSLCLYLYLLCFGFIAVTLLCRVYISRHAIVGVLLAFFAFLCLSTALMLLGFLYMVPQYHDLMMKKPDK